MFIKFGNTVLVCINKKERSQDIEGHLPLCLALLGSEPSQNGLNSALALLCGECEPKRPSRVCSHLNNSVIHSNYV